ncbi:MAG TPA: aldo/keto reductase [Candidatus Binataceae bacterium]|nr:aldo/keto reductase [Candidatus Binataceae bacterium]
MEFRNLGRSGLKVSLAGLGCNNFGMRIELEQARAVIDRAIEVGITLFDTADIYGGRGKSEEMLGHILGARRKDIVLASKCGMAMGDGPYRSGSSRRYIVSACEGSLKRLATDYIDLYQIHQPDSSTPEEETLAALDDLVHSGKVRYVGHSNYAGWQTADAHWLAKTNHYTPYISAQNEWSLLNRAVERDLAPACKQFGVGILPFFPLASGFLTGKYKRGAAMPEGSRLGAMKMLADRVVNDANFATVEKLDEFAKSRERSMVELAMSWLASHQEVGSVIAGATRPEQVTENAKAVEWKISDEELKAIDKLTRQYK